jgi:hypothetical protein
MLSGFDSPYPVSLGLVRRQLPADQLALLLPFTGIKPFAALRASIHPAPHRNPVLLIAPVIHKKSAHRPRIKKEGVLSNGIALSVCCALLPEGI